jgi:hypothetical protein
MGAVEHLKTLCCLGLKPEGAIVAVTPCCTRSFRMAGRVSGCASQIQRWALPTAKIRKEPHAEFLAFPPPSNCLRLVRVYRMMGRSMSLRDKHRTLGELHDASRAAPDHPLVQCRMGCRNWRQA